MMVLAMHLAQRIASLLRNVIDHPTKVLYDPQTEPLFFSQLGPSSVSGTSQHCIEMPRATELSRDASGLVKSPLQTYNSDRVIPQQRGGKGSKGSKNPQQGKSLAGFKAWFVSMSWINTLYIWFPASWAPSVVESRKFLRLLGRLMDLPVV